LTLLIGDDAKEIERSHSAIVVGPGVESIQRGGRRRGPEAKIAQPGRGGRGEEQGVGRQVHPLEPAELRQHLRKTPLAQQVPHGTCRIRRGRERLLGSHETQYARAKRLKPKMSASTSSNSNSRIASS